MSCESLDWLFSITVKPVFGTVRQVPNLNDPFSLSFFHRKVSITLQVINGLYTGVTTQELDTLAAETAATMTTEHADYAVLAARISVSNLHKETKKSFSGRHKKIHRLFYHLLAPVLIFCALFC